MFPAIASLSENMGLFEKLERTFLPALTLVLVVMAHMMRMTRAAIINVIALNLAYLITGVVVVEVVFVYPGIGQLFVDSVKIRDIPVVQACCLIFAGAYILLNLTADVLSILSNPRLRLPK
jgi:peptide/nickel transport system permease protein